MSKNVKTIIFTFLSIIVVSIIAFAFVLDKFVDYYGKRYMNTKIVDPDEISKITTGLIEYKLNE